MKYRRFGGLDIQVSEIGIGTARLSGLFETSGPQQSIGLLRSAFDQGITFFDTSDLYGQGQSEIFLGRAVRGIRPHVVIATKAGYVPPAARRVVSRMKPLLRPIVRQLGITRPRFRANVGGALAQDFSPAYILGAVERSLKRLGTDYVDVFLLHSPSREVLERDDYLAPLQRLKRDGKARSVGVSCDWPDDALHCLEHAEIDTLELPINLLMQDALPRVLPEARRGGVGVIARQCFAGGALAYHHDVEARNARLADDHERERAQRYGALAASMGRPLREVALRFVLDSPGVSVTLVGVHSQGQLEDALRDARSPALTAADYLQLREAAQSHGEEKRGA